MRIIILGMHRSGTSMITGLLQQCGLYLGEPEALMPPHPEDNAEGYWEHQAISNLNEEMLVQLGGNWRTPPPLVQGWSNHEALETFWQRFNHLTADFDSHGDWGWKDPRNSLTLEFWLKHMPDLKVLLCLRNPFEVAESLSTGKPMRDMTPSAALALWGDYHRAIFQQNILDRVIVTHYDSYFYDAKAELQRVLAALALPVSAHHLENALKTIHPTSKHQRIPDSLASDDIESDEVRQYYETLCQRAGEVFQKQRSDSDYVLKSTESYARRLRGTIAQLKQQLHQKDEKIDVLDDEIQQKNIYLEQQILLFQKSVANHKRLIDRQRNTIIELNGQLAAAHKKLAILAQLATAAFQGYAYRRLQRSKIIRAVQKLKNFWSVRRVTRAIRTGQLTVPALFNAEWYVEQYPEVKQAKIHPYVHFWLFGWYQEYQPMPLFDVRWYVTNYPYFNDQWANPLEHYESIGQFNGCRPNAEFDPAWYLSHYTDVKAAGIDPLYHFYKSGLSEGRAPSREAEAAQYQNQR